MPDEFVNPRALDVTFTYAVNDVAFGSSRSTRTANQSVSFPAASTEAFTTFAPAAGPTHQAAARPSIEKSCAPCGGGKPEARTTGARSRSAARSGARFRTTAPRSPAEHHRLLVGSPHRRRSMALKAFRVTGEFWMGHVLSPFTQETVAANADAAKDRVLSTIG